MAGLTCGKTVVNPKKPSEITGNYGKFKENKRQTMGPVRAVACIVKLLKQSKLFSRTFRLTPLSTAPTMQPESSDGFASVGTILPEERAVPLPGGSFRL
jgi:hypothetical protein